MTVVAPLQPSKAQWSFSSITNTCEQRSVAGRKRGREEDNGYALKKGSATETSEKRQSKRPKLGETTNSASNASVDDRRYVPLLEDMPQTVTEHQTASDSHESAHTSQTSEHGLDISKVLALLLEAINETTKQEQEKENSQRHATPSPSPQAYEHRPSSPLCGLPERAPYIRRQIGGSCHGRVDPGIQRWVLEKNLLRDIQTSRPSQRSSEWIETLHEMGWEHYNPSYMGHCEAYIPDHRSDDWVEIDVTGGSSRYRAHGYEEEEIWDVTDNTSPTQTITVR
ncbi:hypothetical protein M422DRAFT_244833 [Sphaerobolus stellatus SS14]|nr:hypothetical protein M422DRAFT_244833 [Sphaerobolus stellatus SS14]